MSMVKKIMYLYIVKITVLCNLGYVGNVAI